MVQFSKLKLTGFKSFSQTTEIDILDGITGVIGPNGCGKSNLVESIRWIMGENSAKNMRGGAMDDVIFSGTGKRPPHNFAQVTLTVDNRSKTAPKNFNDDETIEISRRIERGMGSDYRINGKLVRASDVKLFFADTATGSHSPAIVSQGRVSDLIHSKPTDRRMVLEEAAAISGLHSRRKEAEQRLRASEKNLLRLDDIVANKEQVYASLKKQARQAIRYRKLSDTIRRLEATMTLAEWQKNIQEFDITHENIKKTNDALNIAKQHLFEIQKERENIQSTQKLARKKLEERLNNKRDLDLEKSKIDEKLSQIDERKHFLLQQKEQISNDLEHEKGVFAASDKNLNALYAEKSELEKEINVFDETFNEILEKRDTAKTAYDDAYNALTQRKSNFIAQKTQRDYLEKQKLSLKHNQEYYQTQRAELQKELEHQKENLAQKTDHEKTLRHAISSQEEFLQNQQAKREKLQTQHETLNENHKKQESALNQKKQDLTQLKTEFNALNALIDNNANTKKFKTVLQDISVQSGYETALSVALGKGLQAGLDQDAPYFWSLHKENKTQFNLPEGSVSLIKYVEAPKNLHTALSQIGVVEDQNKGKLLAKNLKSGQSIVTKEGYAWRWDGLTITPEASDLLNTKTEQENLKQRNRLKILEKAITKAEKALSQQQENYNETEINKNQSEQNITQIRTEIEESYDVLNQKRQALTKYLQETAQKESAIKTITDQIEHILEKQKNDQKNLDQICDDLSKLLIPEKEEDALSKLEEEVNQLQRNFQENQERYADSKNAILRAKNRHKAVEEEIIESKKRKENASERVKILETRYQENQTKLSDIEKAPEELNKKLQDIVLKLQEEEKSLSAVEQEFEDYDQNLTKIIRNVEKQQEVLSSLREKMARLETQYQNIQQTIEQIKNRSQQQFKLDPDHLSERFDIELNQQTEKIDDIRNQFERYRNERERIGAVNLRAEEESHILSKEIEEIKIERQDVFSAIEELRQAINKLNQDARKKMLVAFEEINKNFQSIFKRLFNGGEAHLELVDAHDPLNTGLEIYASPPGKRMQNLSLLSGGEQGLTAIALIFAMFLTTPAPICILDEIDAPLDDSNVERICDLLNDFSNDPNNKTRFLVITHNPITMARVDRLYGVTMAEKGISKLISVDLAKQSGAQPENQQLELS